MLAIEELHKRLLFEGIPHDYDSHTEGNPVNIEYNQIIYPSRENYVGDFVQHFLVKCGERMSGVSYGADQNLMEGMGFDICREKDGDDVKGWIGVEEAYQMIKKVMQEG